MESIAAVVITKDEERNIADCLASVVWVDEIVVVEACSTDRTVELARRFSDKMFVRPWPGYGPPRSLYRETDLRPFQKVWNLYHIGGARKIKADQKPGMARPADPASCDLVQDLLRETGVPGRRPRIDPERLCRHVHVREI